MLFKYNGDHKKMIVFGYDFSDGPVDVPEEDKHAIIKLAGNSHFDEVSGEEEILTTITDNGDGSATVSVILEYAVFKKDGQRALKLFDSREDAEAYAKDKFKDLEAYEIKGRPKKG